jgi:hypothetical protein
MRGPENQSLILMPLSVASKLCPEAKAPHARRKSYFPTSHHATRKTQTLTAMPRNTASTAALLIPPTRRRY